MPNIKEFDTPALGLTPSDRGASAFARVGRRIGAFYNQAAQSITTAGARLGGAIASAGEAAVNYQDHKQIREGAAHGTQLFDALTQSKDEAIKAIDPNDPGYASKVDQVVKQWREEQLEPALEKFRDGFTTEKSQAWADHFVNATRQHMFTASAADITTAAGIGLKSDVKTMVSTASNAAVRDPSSVKTQLDLLEHSVDGMVQSSPVKGTDAARLKTEILDEGRKAIVHAGAIGAIAKADDPEAVADAWIAKYPEYISGAAAGTLKANARQQIRADRVDKTYADHNAKVAEQDRSDKTETAYLGKLYSDDPREKLSVSTRAVVNDPNLTRVAKERLINVVNREIKPETAAQTSNRNYIGVLTDIRNGRISDVGPIYQARIDGKLDRADFNQALKDFADFRSPEGEALAKDRAEFFKRYAPAIDPSMSDPGTELMPGHFSALGSQKMYEAEKAARRAEEDARKQGKDPHSVYDPSSPNFFGKPENMTKYRASLQDAIRYQKQISSNLTGEGKESHVVSVENKPVFRAPASWQYSASRNQFKDPATGKIYNREGVEIK